MFGGGYFSRAFLPFFFGERSIAYSLLIRRCASIFLFCGNAVRKLVSR
jgi:hypothetical protein